MALNVREIAEAFAEKSAKNEPNIQEIHFFPSEKELRIVAIDPTAPLRKEKSLAVYYFAPDKELPLRLGIGLIPPDQKGKIGLPRSWGGWAKAIKVWPKEAN